MQNKINLGIIGKNFGYNVIYKSFLKNKNYKIKGFCFKSKKTSKLKIPNNIKIYSNWKRLVLDKKINAIAISSPPATHKKIVKFAIRNNKHIFCEKPLTCSYNDASIICNLVKKKKISHMVNYQFANIDTFQFFKKKIMKNLKISEIYLNWFINIKKRSNNNWKENHSKGGGIIFNYICHSIYYLEFLFGKISSVKTKILIKRGDKIKTLKGIIFFSKGLSVKLNIKVRKLNNKIYPIHQLKIFSIKKNYILESNLNSLYDKFKLLVGEKNSKKTSKVIFKEKNRKEDFRIKPTLKNSRKFSNWILKGRIESPNFYDARRIHLIIEKINSSSEKNKRIYIN